MKDKPAIEFCHKYEKKVDKMRGGDIIFFEIKQFKSKRYHNEYKQDLRKEVNINHKSYGH